MGTNDAVKTIQGVQGPAGPPGPATRSFTISNPTNAINTPVVRLSAASTITAVHALCIGGTNVVGQVNIYDVNGANGSAVTTDMTATAGTEVDVTGLAGAVVAGGYVGWRTTSVGGAPVMLIVTFDVS